MRLYDHNVITHRSCINVVLLMVLAFMSTSASAQIRRIRTAPIDQRQADLRSLRRNQPEHRNRIVELDWVAIAEDFKAIQIENETLYNSAHASQLDYELIRSTAGHLKKLADRLETNLGLPAVDAESVPKFPAISTSEEIRSASEALNEKLAAFVSSPVFDSLDAVDVRQATEAHITLISISKLSRTIRKGAANLAVRR